nr:uncharacterized protein LOC4327875 [Oryza sativa Japonica Group]
MSPLPSQSLQPHNSSHLWPSLFKIPPLSSEAANTYASAPLHTRAHGMLDDAPQNPPSWPFAPCTLHGCSAMDHSNSPPVPDIGSFSYSWPTNKPLARADDDTHARGCSFDFSPPSFECSKQAAAMAHADQMFRDGLLLPLRAVRRQGGGGGGDDDGGGGDVSGAPKRDAIPVLLRPRYVDSAQRITTTIPASKRHLLPRLASPSSPRSSLRVAAAPGWSPSSVLGLGASNKLRLPSLGRRCGRVLPRRLSCKCLTFLEPLYQKMASCCVGRRITTRHAYGRAAADESRNIKVCEDAIRDAILHCKTSL